MSEQFSIYRCNECGCMIEIIKPGKDTPSCCGKAMETLEYKCWFYEAAQEAGTVAAPQSMTVENIPEEHRKTYRRLKELVE